MVHFWTTYNKESQEQFNHDSFDYISVFESVSKYTLSAGPANPNMEDLTQYNCQIIRGLNF